MTGLLGYSHLVDTALPALWDNDSITELRLQSGMTLGEVLAMLQAGLALATLDFAADPVYGQMLRYTDEIAIEYMAGGGTATGVRRVTDQSVPDPKRGYTGGHMLPIADWGDAVGWSVRGLKKLRQAKIDSDIQRAIDDARNHYYQRFLTRLFTKEGVTVGSTANASQPFMDGGDASGTFVPPVGRGGQTFLSTHDHYTRIAATTAALVEAGIEHLAEHKIPEPYTIIIPNVAADKTTFSGLANFVPRSNAGIIYSTTTTRVGSAGNSGLAPRWFGMWEGDNGLAHIYTEDRLPTNYWAVVKAYGAGHIDSPIVARTLPDEPFGFQIVPGQWANMPNALAAWFSEFDFGVGNRLAGYFALVAGAGDYVTPTIS